MRMDAQLVDDLELSLRRCRIQEGIELLSRCKTGIVGFDRSKHGTGHILLVYAQWIDAGFGDYRLIEPVLAEFPAQCRKDLPLGDYVGLRMVEAFVDFSRGEPDRAIEILGPLLRICHEFHDPLLEALAHFWKGRAHRRNGEYEAALKHVTAASNLAHDRDRFFGALIDIQQSWLLFQKDQTREAEQLLNRAESILQSTDHYIALANIESARGRFVRRSGHYSEALAHFAKAVKLYAKRDPNHVNLARTLVNAAYVRRLMALKMRKQIDADARTGRERAGAGRHTAEQQAAALARYQRTCHDAVQDLMRARQIYALHANHDGIGKVSLNLAYLYLDKGDIESAELEATNAYSIGDDQKDRILMARARIVQTAIENAHVEEQTGDADEIGSHANRAKEFSEEAVTLALGTQNRRLQAAACIARGTTAANDFFQDWETARVSASEATRLIGPGERDHLLEDLALLKSQIIRASGINDVLRSWSEGFVGSKTFQQVVEEFAEIVIPKVWIRQDRKISRVSASLSISPKKVRRILRNSGLLDPHGKPSK